jgi:hypothetical protein
VISPERAYALLIEANPVSEPEVLSTAPDLRPVGDTAGNGATGSVDSTAVAAPAAEPVGRRWRTSLVAAVVAILVAAGHLTVYRTVLSGAGSSGLGASTADVVFTGESCDYRGPLSLAAGRAEFSVERLAGTEPVAVLVLRIVDDEVTLADVTAWAAEQPGERIPPGVSNLGTAVYLTEDVADVLSMPLYAGRYVLTCNTAPEGTNRAYPAAVLEVGAG